jgi:hypothetical protein
MKLTFYYIQMGALLFILALSASTVQAEARFEDGWWRAELFGAGGIDSGGVDRTGELMINGAIEYEFPLAQRTTLGLRLLPLFVYTQDDDHDKKFLGINFDHHDDDADTVWGGGAGLAFRFYSVKDEYRGFFGEIEGHVLGHGNEFEGNGSNINFLTGVGLGYKFKNELSLVVKYNHISNAGLDSDNSGINTIGLGLGYSF